MSHEALVRAFEMQALWGERLASPFTGATMRAAARDLAEGGPVADIVGDWTGQPTEDALPTRLGGALHAAVLTGRDEALAREFPTQNAKWDIDRIWPIVREYLKRDRDWVRAFLQSPPQTNETRRSIGLLPGFLSAARGGPLHLLEIGASAGLNQMWDQFRFEAGGWSWGEDRGVTISTEWRGQAPTDLSARVEVASRAGCDRAPLDVNNPEHDLRLRAFVWADQPDRLRRLEAAMALARKIGVRIEKADAGAWIEEELRGGLPPGVTVIFHSVVWQYLGDATRARVTDAIEAAGAQADEAHRLVWLRYEPNLALGIDGPFDGMSVVRSAWPARKTALLIRTDGHARAMDYVGEEELGANLK